MGRSKRTGESIFYGPSIDVPSRRGEREENMRPSNWSDMRLARALVEGHGDDIFVLHRDGDPLDALQISIIKEEGEQAFFCLDVRDKEAWGQEDGYRPYKGISLEGLTLAWKEVVEKDWGQSFEGSEKELREKMEEAWSRLSEEEYR